MSGSVISLRDLDRLRQDGARVKPKSKPDLIREALLEYFQTNPLPKQEVIIDAVMQQLPDAREIALWVEPPVVPAAVVDPSLIASLVNQWVNSNRSAIRGDNGVGIEDIRVDATQPNIIIFTLTDGRIFKIKIPRSRGGNNGSVVQNVTASIRPDWSVRRITADDVTKTSDDVILVDSPSLVTVTLADSAARKHPVHIKRMNTGDVKLLPAAGTLDGDPYKIINSRYTSISVMPDLTDMPNWIIAL